MFSLDDGTVVSSIGALGSAGAGAGGMSATGAGVASSIGAGISAIGSAGAGGIGAGSIAGITPSAVGAGSTGIAAGSGITVESLVASSETGAGLVLSLFNGSIFVLLSHIVPLITLMANTYRVFVV